MCFPGSIEGLIDILCKVPEHTHSCYFEVLVICFSNIAFIRAHAKELLNSVGNMLSCLFMFVFLQRSEI